MRLPLKVVNACLSRFGWRLTRFDSPENALLQRQRLYRHFRIDMVLDVGANRGQFAESLWEMGYTGLIHSFEPTGDAYTELEKRANGDPNWVTSRIALGNADETRTIQVTDDDRQSSFCEISPALATVAPEIRVNQSYQVEVRRLDSIFDDFPKDRRILLKLDTQGFELPILKGAAASLSRIVGIQLEAPISRYAMYEQSTSMVEFVQYLEQHGFGLWAIEPGFGDR